MRRKRKVTVKVMKRLRNGKGDVQERKNHCINTQILERISIFYKLKILILYFIKKIKLNIQ